MIATFRCADLSAWTRLGGKFGNAFGEHESARATELRFDQA